MSDIFLWNRNFAEDFLDDVFAGQLFGFGLDPGTDRLSFTEDEWALHPLADSATDHYRFASGDTLRLAFASGQPDIVLYEILVEPRRSDFRLIAGSLWFDS